MSLPLFDTDEPARVEPGPLPPVPPYQPTSPTSEAGARKAQASAAAQCARLLAAYRTHGEGLTDAEAAYWTGLDRTSVIPRRHALMRDGLVVETGARVNPKSGVKNAVYGVKA